MSTKKPGLQRFRDAGGGDSTIRVEAARIAARRGNRKEARQLLRSAVEADPRCTEAWLGLAWLAETSTERRNLLRHVLALDPGDIRAQAELARLERGSAAPIASPSGSARSEAAPAGLQRIPPSSERIHKSTSSVGPASGLARKEATEKRRSGWGTAVRWVVALGAVVLLLAATILAWGPIGRSLASLLPTPTPSPAPTPTASPGEIAGRFAPQLENALLGAAWDRAVEIVTIMQSVAPSDPAVAGWARKAHLQIGQALVGNGLAGDALTHFDQALAAVPGDTEALLWQSTTQAYLAGRKALLAGDWEGAVAAMLLVQAQIPGYADGRSRLLEAYLGLGRASIAAADWTRAIDALTQAQTLNPTATGIVDSLQLSYRERGISRQAAGNLVEARADLEAALALAPGDAKARTHLDQVMYQLFPPKRIEIDISEQRMYVYLGDKLLHKWVISTGLPGRDTATGHYKVLDKIPMAYSKVWNLKMPYWLGIYYVGGIENGIHALPIRPDGSVMWAGLLGQKASYGCVILDNTAAPILYNWADIGTKVDIRY